MNGSKRYWWFSNNAVKERTRDTLTLNPQWKPSETGGQCGGLRPGFDGAAGPDKDHVGIQASRYFATTRVMSSF
jgi:hypothetical protein